MKLEKHLEKLANLEDVSIDTEAEYQGKNVKELYCDLFPYAIQVHEMALQVVKNPFAKIIIQIAIALLTAIGKRFCEEKTEEVIPEHFGA